MGIAVALQDSRVCLCLRILKTGWKGDILAVGSMGSYVDGTQPNDGTAYGQEHQDDQKGP